MWLVSSLDWWGNWETKKLRKVPSVTQGGSSEATTWTQAVWTQALHDTFSSLGVILGYVHYFWTNYCIYSFDIYWHSLSHMLTQKVRGKISSLQITWNGNSQDQMAVSGLKNHKSKQAKDTAIPSYPWFCFPQFQSPKANYGLKILYGKFHK